jgi:hypothetical protein
MTHPISELQRVANQANALKSTGPRTEEGRAKSRYNARRHGLTGQFYVMSEGDEAAYVAHEEAMLADLKPVGAHETQLAISIIQDYWRINRTKGSEFTIFGHDYEEGTGNASANIQTATTMASTWKDQDRRFSNMALYETRLHRIIVSNEKRLKALQDERKSAEAAAREEAELLLRLALMKKQPIDNKAPIEANGFVFSTLEILGSINRKEALNEARFFAKNGWDPDNRFRKAA